MKQLSWALAIVRATLNGYRAWGCQHFSETRGKAEQRILVVCGNIPVTQGKQCWAHFPRAKEGQGG